MNKKLFIYAIIFILFFLIISITFAQNTQAFGVNAGETYSYDFQTSSPAPTQELVGINTFRVDVLAVNNSNYVYFRETMIYQNGQQQVFEHGRTQPYNSNNIFYNARLFYAPNLNANDNVELNTGYSLYVKETIIRNYNGVNRETNHLEFDQKVFDSANQEYNLHYDIYFDRKTGVAVEIRKESTSANSNLVVFLEIKIKESNVWAVQGPTTSQSNSPSASPVPSPSIPEFQSWTILLLPSIMVVVAGLFFYNKIHRQ